MNLEELRLAQAKIITFSFILSYSKDGNYRFCLLFSLSGCRIQHYEISPLQYLFTALITK